MITIQVPDGRGSGVCVCEFCKAKTLRPPCILVVDKPEVEDLPSGAESLHDLFFCEAWKILVGICMGMKVSQTIRYVAYIDAISRF